MSRTAQLLARTRTDARLRYGGVSAVLDRVRSAGISSRSRLETVQARSEPSRKRRTSTEVLKAAAPVNPHRAPWA
jgi:hypothetical protein